MRLLSRGALGALFLSTFTCQVSGALLCSVIVVELAFGGARYSFRSQEMHTGCALSNSIREGARSTASFPSHNATFPGFVEFERVIQGNG